MARGRPPHRDVLTPGEWRVVEAVRHGLTNAEIARRRGVSLDAVKQHVASALAKLGVPSRQALKHWSGIRAESALRGKDHVMPDALALGPLGQIARATSDVRAAEAWFRDVLGLRHLFTFGDLAFFDCGGVRLLLEKGEAAGASLLYFRVPDIRAAHAELAARSVVFRGAPHMIHRHADGTEEWMAFFDDNEGRPLALMSQVRG